MKLMWLLDNNVNYTLVLKWKENYDFIKNWIVRNGEWSNFFIQLWLLVISVFLKKYKAEISVILHKAVLIFNLSN